MDLKSRAHQYFLFEVKLPSWKKSYIKIKVSQKLLEAILECLDLKIFLGENTPRSPTVPLIIPPPLAWFHGRQYIFCQIEETPRKKHILHVHQ